MGKPTQFFLQGKPHVAESPLSVRELLKMADVSPAAFCIEVMDGTVLCDPDQMVTIQDGYKLELKRRPPAGPPQVHYKVNGEEQTTTINPVSVEAVLRQAGAAASIDIADPGNYYIESITGGSKYQNLNDLITIKEGDQFLAIHVGPTPVA